MPVLGLIIFVTWIAGIVGWVMNIMNIIEVIDLEITGVFVIQCIGVVVAPLGAVMGWII